MTKDSHLIVFMIMRNDRKTGSINSISYKIAWVINNYFCIIIHLRNVTYKDMFLGRSQIKHQKFSIDLVTAASEI